MGCADAPIGIPGRLKGLSGGQKKRLAIASEVLVGLYRFHFSFRSFRSLLVL